MATYSVVTCDHCGAKGERPAGGVSPVGWKFLVTRTTPPGHEIILYACSVACIEAIEQGWTPGPGVLRDVLS